MEVRTSSSGNSAGGHDGRFSPDGKYIAFTSDESGRNGTDLFFSHPLSMYSTEFAVMAVDVETGETFSAGVPRELF